MSSTYSGLNRLSHTCTRTSSNYRDDMLEWIIHRVSGPIHVSSYWIFMNVKRSLQHVIASPSTAIDWAGHHVHVNVRVITVR